MNAYVQSYILSRISPFVTLSKMLAVETEYKGIHLKATVVNSTKFSLLFPTALFPLSSPFPPRPAAVTESMLCPGLHIF